MVALFLMTLARNLNRGTRISFIQCLVAVKRETKFVLDTKNIESGDLSVDPLDYNQRKRNGKVICRYNKYACVKVTFRGLVIM